MQKRARPRAARGQGRRRAREARWSRVCERLEAALNEGKRAALGRGRRRAREARAARAAADHEQADVLRRQRAAKTSSRTLDTDPLVAKVRARRRRARARTRRGDLRRDRSRDHAAAAGRARRVPGSRSGSTEPSLNNVIRTGYGMLDLITYFTAGKQEVRAWTIKRGTKAPGAAGKIHTDFERGFIRAEVIWWEDLDRARDRSRLQGRRQDGHRRQGVRRPRRRRDALPVQRISGVTRPRSRNGRSKRLDRCDSHPARFACRSRVSARSR